MGNPIESDVDNAQNVIQQGQQLTSTQQLALLACFKATLTLEEAAAYSGISISYLYKLTSKGKLGHFKPNGKLIFIDKREFDAWLKSNWIKTTEEIERDSMTYVSATSAIGGRRA